MRIGRVVLLGMLLATSGCQPRPGSPPAPAAPASEPSLTFRGVVTNEGVECPSVRDGQGRLYTLTGTFGNLRPGDRVCVKGKRVQVSSCMQGITVAVDWIGAAANCP